MEVATVDISGDRPGLIESMSKAEQCSQGRLMHVRQDELNCMSTALDGSGSGPDSPRP